MGLRKIVKLFEKRSVLVEGEKGDGKDMLFANIIARRGKPYISNTNYKVKGKKGLKAKFTALDLNQFKCGENTYKNFIDGNVKKYVYPYPDGMDIYISDVGIYFPAQYCSELNRDYKYFPIFFALSRQLGEARIHTNCQVISRCWDKLREQSGTYILCKSCHVFLGFVFQRVWVYEKYDSAVAHVPPFRFKLGLFAKKEMKNFLEIEKMKYTLTHGEIKSHFLIYRNKTKYNTRIFKEMLENGK